MPLIGNRYVQAGDPATGSSGFVGYQWQNTTTGKLYERKSDDSGWQLIYMVDQDRGGLIPVTGGAVTGAITGTTGWAPVDQPDFNTSAKIGGVNIATVNYVDSIATGLSDSISAQINQAIASSSATTQVNANIAKAKGYTAGRNPAVSGTEPSALAQIPLPSYPNGGSQAQEAECVWFACMADTKSDATSFGAKLVDNTVGPASWVSVFYEESSRAYKSYLVQGGSTPWSGSSYCGLGINWLIFGVKSTS